MKYLKAYLSATVSIIWALGAFYLVLGILFGDGIALYFLYLTLITALAGPIREALK